MPTLTDAPSDHHLLAQGVSCSNLVPEVRLGRALDCAAVQEPHFRVLLRIWKQIYSA